MSSSSVSSSSLSSRLVSVDLFSDDVAQAPIIPAVPAVPIPAHASSSSSSEDTSHRSTRIRKPVELYGDWDYSFSAESYMMEIDEWYTDPSSFNQAMSSPKKDAWICAMQDEIASNIDKQVWHLVELPPGKRALTSKWVYCTKTLADGTKLEKAWIVARGFEQVQGVDFHEIFAPTIRSKSLHTLLAIGAVEDMEIHQLDVKTAFLNGTLQEEVYMRQPQGFVDPDFPQLVCKLNKSLYGLRQAPRAWFDELIRTLSDMRLHPHPHDSAVYLGDVDGHCVFIGIYVDDMPILASNLSTVMKVKDFIASRYEIKDLGEIKFILGIRVTHDRSCHILTLSQADYIDKVVASFNLSAAKPLSIPIKHHWDLWPHSADLSSSDLTVLSHLPYRQLIDSMMYAMTGTRPDIAYTIGKLSQYLCSLLKIISMQPWISCII